MSVLRTRRLSAAMLTAATVAACAPAVSPPAPAPAASTTTLLVRLGADTLSVEQYTRTASGMEGVVVSRAPVTTVARYSVRIGADNAPVGAEYQLRRADGSMVAGSPQSLSVRYGVDSMTITAHRATGDTTRTIAVRGWLLPFINYSQFELGLSRLLAAGRDSAEFAMVPLNFGVRASFPAPLTLLGRDSARISWFGYPQYIRHDGRGGLLWLDGRQSTIKVRVDRVATMDVNALAQAWAARDATIGAAGAASTRDTARATIGAAHVWVDYGRPALRGRDVWANGVLGDTLWRTGANAATQLGTDADLMIGGQLVPAGTYSLFTWAGREGYHLVINRQAGQWGTEYHPERDLVRVPLRESAGAPTERFTIALEPQGANAASLVLAWGTKRLSVPVTTR